MLQINVALPNGHAELFKLLPSSTVQDLSAMAQRAFGKKYLRLITAKNRVLIDPDTTLQEAEIEDGECLTALVLQPQLAATEVRLPCGVMEITQSLPGVIDALAVTVRQFKVSLGVWTRFKPQSGPLLRFWQMDPS